MVGGLLQLKEKGAQDLYLTGQPQITFFKTVYRRYTNFSVESIEQLFDVEVTHGSTCRANISRKGDLIHKIYLQQEIKTGTQFKDEGNLKNYGYNFLKRVDLTIGSKLVDSHTSNWLETYVELTQPNEYGNFTSAHNALFMNSSSDINGYTATRFQSMCMAGGVGIYKTITHYTNSPAPADPTETTSASLIPSKEQVTASGRNVDGVKPFINNNGDLVNDYAEYLYNNEHHYIYTPLQFWFCRNIGLALPLIALQYNDVIIDIVFSNFITDNIENRLKMYVDYIFLDTDERRRFSQISHEYLIEQVQIGTKGHDINQSNLLNFSHPVKELIWVSGDGSKADYGDKSLIGQWTLEINGYDRFSLRDITYFTKQQVNDYHTGYGGVTTKNSIAVYSFALNPEDHQPSGTLNFSIIKNIYLNCKLYNGQTSTDVYTVYAINYNILRILSGQAGLAYV
tara:strand:- start:366 stop:1727 length:1362 start_codon:yes stop_codon:yes gene_type:complete